MNKFKKGDKVYVIDWGKIYSSVTGNNGVFFKCPIYSAYSFFKDYKNYKYEVEDFMYHPKAGEYSQTEEIREYWKDKGGMDDKYTTLPIYLLKSINNPLVEVEQCYVEVEEGGISTLTPSQYKDKEFNALKEYNRGKWSIDDDLKEFPKELLENLYDENDRVLFGSSMTRGLITYSYIPGEYTLKGIPIIASTSCSYDGKGNSQLLADAKLVRFTDLPKMFPENKFSY